MQRTTIGWTHWSVNPFKMEMPDGSRINVCIHKSDGCRNCYAETLVKRWWHKDWGEFPGYTAALLKIGKPVLVETNLRKVLFLSKSITRGEANPKLNRVFWNDMTDEYLDYWPDEFIDACYAIRALTPNLIHQVLTKRPDRMLYYLRDRHGSKIGYPNVHLGVSAERQAEFDDRWAVLRRIPAAVRFLSLEPLLEYIDPQSPMWETLDEFVWPEWVIIGGESGHGRREVPIHELTQTIKDFSVISPVYVKQDSALFPGQQGRIPNEYWQHKSFPKVAQ